MGRMIPIIGAALCVSFSEGVAATTWYVDCGVLASGNGLSWWTAFEKMQEGIDAASDGDTVVVAEGTYVENIHFNGNSIVLRSIDPPVPDVVANTIIDGSQSGSVVTLAGTEDERCVISGFTIRNGRSDKGAGICGGTWDNHADVTVRNNVISGNSADWYGGVAYCDGLIDNNVVTENSAIFDGGGLCRCNGTIHNNIVCGNSAGQGGGGLDDCDGTIWNNTIGGNSAAYYGGGLDYCSGPIRNNTIAGNSAMWGGGLRCCDGTVENNAITGNSADYGGGLSACGGTIQNNTIWGNSARWGGGLYCCQATVRNCIIWRNTASESGSQVHESNVPSSSCIEAWPNRGTGNIDKDPLLADANQGDYRLQTSSPCIDLGINYYWFVWPQRDLDGNSRLAGKRVDIGCYEYASSQDSDGDLLSDRDERACATDPLREDTDGDGLRDGLEILRGSDALHLTPPRVVHVPSDIRTVQKSLCLAVSGDEIIVAPGTYAENLQFCGVDVILRSSDPEDSATVTSTVLDGLGAGPLVSFTGTETAACVLSGFAITAGSAHSGGGICGGTSANHTHATIRNNVLTGNRADHGGALAYCDGSIQGNLIKGNSAKWDGGGLESCYGTIQNNIVMRNSVSWDGGGLSRCYGTIRNNAIIANSANACGGGLHYCYGSIQNNTVSGNSADERGGGLDKCGGTIMNCIVWGNTALGGAQIWKSDLPLYCCVQDWSAGGDGNISQDPRFVDPLRDDYRLKADSPCVDRGVDQYWMWDALDLDGNPRIFYGISSKTVDMGAYEYNSLPFTLRRLVMDGGFHLIWYSQPGDRYIVWSRFDLLRGLWNEEARISSDGESTAWIDPDTTSTRKFYRIQMEH